MFKANLKELKLSFNEFHKVKGTDLPEYGNYCLLELKDGRYTAGEWLPKNYKAKKAEGSFNRGTGDSVDIKDVAKWHALECYDLSSCLENENITQINLGPEEEGAYSVKIGDFKRVKAGSLPPKDRFCLLIMKNGRLAAGRWYPYSAPNDGCFIYASALASHSKKNVWAWAPLSPDDVSEREEQREKERKLEEKLNKNPTVDPGKFKYGTDINVYYEKALEKLRMEYPWARMPQLKKRQPYVIVPRHGQYIFGLDNGTFMGSKQIREWTDGSTADEFIDFLCEYTRDHVQNSNPEVKFTYGTDIEVYREMAFERVKKDYRWLDKSMLDKNWHYTIKEVDGDLEYVRENHSDSHSYVCDYSSADNFLENLEYEYQNAALSANPVVDKYPVPFGHVDICGWNLEQYVFSKLKTGDYKVDVTAGDRTTGGSREFFITPDCFEAKTYSEFLDRYLEIVPGGSFGLFKSDLLPDRELQKFLGY